MFIYFKVTCCFFLLISNSFLSETLCRYLPKFSYNLFVVISVFSLFLCLCIQRCAIGVFFHMALCTSMSFLVKGSAYFLQSPTAHTPTCLPTFDVGVTPHRLDHNTTCSLQMTAMCLLSKLSSPHTGIKNARNRGKYVCNLGNYSRINLMEHS